IRVTSPNRAEMFPADSRLLGFRRGHDAFGSRKDRQTEPAHDLRDPIRLDILTQTGLRNPLQAGDNRLLEVSVLKLEIETKPRPSLDRHFRHALEIALIHEDLSDRTVQTGVEDVDLGVTPQARVANSGQEIRKLIVHHKLSTLFPEGEAKLLQKLVGVLV